MLIHVVFGTEINISFSQFNTLNNALARCPHCRKISSVGPDFARGRGIAFIVVGIIALVIAIGTTVSTFIVSSNLIRLCNYYSKWI